MNAACPLVKSPPSEAWNLCGCPPSASRSGCPLPGAGCGALSSVSGPCCVDPKSPASLLPSGSGDTSGSLVLSFLCPVSLWDICSVCWTSRARVSVTLCPHPVYEAMGYLEEPGLGNQTESNPNPQLCRSHGLGDLRHMTSPLPAPVSSASEGAGSAAPRFAVSAQ